MSGTLQRTAALIRVAPPSGPPSEWDKLVPVWLHGRPESTRKAYAPVIEDFREFVHSKPVSRVRLEDLQNYYDYHADQRPETVRRKLQTVRSLLDFSHKTGAIPFDVGKALRLPRIVEHLIEKILPEEDIRAMINAEPSLRNRAMIRLLYMTGIRASEAAALTWADVHERDKTGQITVLGKGGKTRAIKLPLDGWKELQKLRPKAVAPFNRVFTREDGKPLTRNRITNIVRAAAKRAGLEQPVSAHWMRHGHASHALDHGAPLALISATLGHSNIATTSRYIHVRPEESSADWIKA